MLRIFEIALPLGHGPGALPQAIIDILQITPADLLTWEVRRQAVDARKKTGIKLVYTVDASLRQEEGRVSASPDRRISPVPDEIYHPVRPGAEPLPHRPLVVGSGPAGMFSALILTQAGYRPLVLERGKAVEERCLDVERFWRDGLLDPESNAQFGEGGAGTFSDGKLNTLINDPRCRKVLEELAAAGAPPSILVSAKPHIGTDRLRPVVRGLRETIIRGGGKVRFRARVTGLLVRDGVLSGLQVNGEEIIECEAAVLAIGHSSRDTIRMLLEQGLDLAPKPFSIGLRIEHPQRLIDEAQFGAAAGHPQLGPGDYKMAWHGEDGRSAYTFCMCPGGEVIAAASEAGGIVTNGMSQEKRAGQNANSGLLVNVRPTDFPGAHPLAGFQFQKQWESLAFRLAGESYAAPVQRLADFMANRPSVTLGKVRPTYRPGTVPSDLSRCLPAYVCATLRQAIPVFARRLRGFDMPDAALTGVETRSSSPVRMTRGEDFQSNIGGLYPAGEGAGYAGGITSAAVDGVRCGEAIIRRFAAVS
jgi:uncharacterized FAD-dependent dehydrogenase